ncbi:hypothetical protein BD410DRAFT_780605 [Rickenella mellea]|uniref:Uncharacterized protein n=1 Tax=Rickenella mellea TaxID=50990 RepID=A0A4R5XHY7_9AGAM|nr:hypothetical protein BD410DRAFT_780605 [Rickenella mellea]
MTPWHPRVMQRFERVPIKPQESDFYGPYNTLLHDHSLFPAAYPIFTVAPQSPDATTGVDSLIEYVISYDSKPVFVLQINDPKRLANAAARRIADRRMRKILQNLAPLCPLPTLNGVSAFGTKLGFYRFSQLNLAFTLPFVVEGDTEVDADPAPQARWITDVLEQDGADKLKVIVGKIKEACGSL